MQMQRMRGGGGRDVHPTIGHADGAAAQIQFQRTRECTDVTGDFFLEVSERAGKTVKFIERRVAGVSTRIILFRPTASRGVEVAQLAALRCEARVQISKSGALQ